MATAHQNPRRVPMQHSVSLRHQARSSPKAVPKAIPKAIPDLNNQNNSSGESTSPEKWFERSNANTQHKARAFVDNDPPFFHRNDSSADSPAGPSSTNNNNNHGMYNDFSLPFMLHGGAGSGPVPLSANNSTDDYRSVIDDLTIENKRLKQKLKKYRRSQRQQEAADGKLFEVRFHGLDVQKKRELEELLRGFAERLVHPAPRKHSSHASSLSAQHAGSFRPSFSHTSTRFADSGYGSMAASHQPSSNQTSSAKATHKIGRNNDPAVHSSSNNGGPGVGKGAGFGSSSGGGDGSGEVRRPDGRPDAENRHRDIRSYLADIPQGLMPRQPPVMTERARKKMVVQRLEQLFGGSGPADGGHQQHQQQQEVSNTAARDDKSALEARGGKTAAEGLREATIMPTDDPMDIDAAGHGTSNANGNSNANANASGVVNGKPAVEASKPLSPPPPEQRPTRPLDLDPHRAQVPTENVRYIRHLGFPLQDADAKSPPTDDQGWVYLNLLTNLAQLHTVNVTPEFVRQAVLEHSEKFELSPDQRKIRWRNTRASGSRGRAGHSVNDSDDSASDSDGSEHSDTSRVRSTRGRGKRSRPIDDDDAAGIAQAGSPASKRRATVPPYVPLLQRRQETLGSSSNGIGSTVLSSYEPEVTGESSGLTSSIRPNFATKRRTSGPLTFYQNSPFYTDLSVDRRRQQAAEDAVEYRIQSTLPLGVPPFMQRERNVSPPLTRLDAAPPPNANSDSLKVAEHDFAFPAAPSTTAREGTREMGGEMTFGASGIANVTPADHFVVSIAQRQTMTPPKEIEPARYASRLSSLLGRRTVQSLPEHETLSVQPRQLQPSALPPATYVMTADDLSDSEDSDAGERDDDGGDEDEGDTPERHGIDDIDDSASESSSAESSSDPSAAASVTSHKPAFGSHAGADSNSDHSRVAKPTVTFATDRDQTLDLLAAARFADPEMIRAKEREYDAEMAERLAEEIPAGSSAATFGGGSGFNSPAELRKSKSSASKETSSGSAARENGSVSVSS